MLFHFTSEDEIIVLTAAKTGRKDKTRFIKKFLPSL